MPGGRRVEQALLGHVGELGGGVVFVARVVGVGVRVGIDVQAHQALVALGHRPHHRHRDRAVAADGDGHGAGLDHAARRLLDAVEGVEDASGRQLDVAAIDHAERGHGIEVGVRGIEAPDQRRLQAHGIGAAARADAERMRAAVERQPEDGRAGAGPGPAVRHAHEGQRQREQLFVGQLRHGCLPNLIGQARLVRKSKAASVCTLRHRLQLVDENVLVRPAHVERGAGRRRRSARRACDTSASPSRRRAC